MRTSIATLNGDTRDLSDELTAKLEASLRGSLLRHESEGYDEARTIWNAMIDRRPALIARCAGAADVMRSIPFAAENHLLLAVRVAGHNIAGKGVYDELHDVNTEILSGPVIYPLSEGRQVVQHYRDFFRDLPEDRNVWAVLRKAPAFPFLPESAHGQEVVILAAAWFGDMGSGKRALKPLERFGPVLGTGVGPHPLVGWQAAFDPLLTSGSRNYWKSHNFFDIADDLIDVALDYTARLPSDQTEIFFGRVGGAVNRIPVDATAYPHRDTEYVMNVHTRWEEPSEDAKCVAWARKYFEATARYAKRKYDPTNLFRLNQNIRP
ncbi:MAG: BBE domain-containing protein [Myxococcales bacterium]|nr:BBE domain-containing protein [Myxococcales bacterium]